MSAHIQSAAAASRVGQADSPARVLVVQVGPYRCGLPMDDVLELHRMVATVPLPGAPDVIEGVVDVRGTILAVLDLRARLGLPRRAARPSDHLVLVRIDGARSVAVRVDRVLDFVVVPPSALVAALGLPANPHLKGAARLEDGLLLIHDVCEFLSDEEAASLDDALAELEAATGP